MQQISLYFIWQSYVHSVFKWKLRSSKNTLLLIFCGYTYLGVTILKWEFIYFTNKKNF